MHNRLEKQNMEYISTKDASAKWGISTTRITILANEGRIPGAHRLGKSWLIPANAVKPVELKANHSGLSKKNAPDKTIDFSFPMYHFRPDWSYIKETQLSEQQQQLLLAESAVLECRFADAYPLLESILQAPDDIVTEIGSLWNAGICCLGLDKTEDFSKIYLRLQMLLANDFSHRDDLVIILDILKTFIETLDSITYYDIHKANIHDQCLPLLCLQNGYSILSNEIMNPGTADTNLLELNLRLLETTSSIIVTQIMHCFLVGIYYLRQDRESAERHAKLALEIAFENKYYFPIVIYYKSFSPIMSSVLAQYPDEFQKHCHKLISQYDKNFDAFLSSIEEHDVISKLTDVDYPYIYAVLMDLPNSAIADKLGISQRTVKRRLDAICEKLEVTSKKDLKEYLHRYL